MIAPRPTRLDPRGVALCLASAAGFGAMAIFAKEAYAGGASIPTLLAIRFTLAAVVLWALVARRAPRRLVDSPPPRRSIGHSPWAGLALGALYAVEATAFYVALERIDAALAELLLFTYPALVVVGAALLGREPLTRHRAQALALSTVGTALVLAAGELSTIDVLGVVAAALAACLYAVCVLISDRMVAQREPLRVSAELVGGGALCFLAYGLVTGAIDLDLTARAWVAIVSIAFLSTVVPIVAFLAGMRRVGVGTATLLSTAEPVVTVTLAMLVLGERLAPVQLVGGALVVLALVRLSRSPRVTPAHEPAAEAARPAPAREVRERAPVRH